MSQDPYTVELDAGTHYFCACGRSKNLPFCDGSHEGTGRQPHEVTLKERQTAYICRCRHSKSLPFCDGTHKTLD